MLVVTYTHAQPNIPDINFRYPSADSSELVITWHWHVGEPMPEFDIHRVLSVQADNDELDHIMYKFPNLPMCKGGRRVVTWFGDHAKFIVANL